MFSDLDHESIHFSWRLQHLELWQSCWGLGGVARAELPPQLVLAQ